MSLETSTDSIAWVIAFAACSFQEQSHVPGSLLTPKGMTLLQLYCHSGCHQQAQDLFDMHYIFLRQFGRDDEVVYIDCGTQIFNEGKNHIFCSLECFRALFQSKRHPCVAIQSTMRSNIHLLFAVLVRFDLPVAWVRIKCRTYICFLRESDQSSILEMG